MAIEVVNSTTQIDRMRYVLQRILDLSHHRPESDPVSIDMDAIVHSIQNDNQLNPLAKENILANLRPILASFDIFAIENHVVTISRKSLELELVAWGLALP